MSEAEKKYLVDIQDAILQIASFLEGVEGFSAYRSNLLVKAGVERKLEIVGEAINRLCQLSPDVAITSKRKIISLRNRIIHAYDAVDDVLIWEVVKKHLPLLKKEIELLLQQPPDAHRGAAEAE